MFAGAVGLAALGGAGFAGNGIGVAGDLAGNGAGHLHHTLPHQIKGGAVVLDDIHHLRLGLPDHLAGVGVQYCLDKVGAVPHTIVGKGGGVGGKLDGGDHRVALSDRRLHIQRGGVVGVVFGGEPSRCLAYLHTGALSQTQLVGIGIVDVTGKAASHVVEEDVAAPLDCRDHVDISAVSMTGAAGMVVLIVVIYTVAVDGGILIDESAVQRCHRHRGLKGGTGGVQTLQRPVEQGQTGVAAVFLVVGGKQVLVVAGVVGGGKDAAILYVNDHRRRCRRLHVAGVVDPVDHVDVVGKCLVHRPLKVAVDRELKGVPRLRHGGELSVHNDAIGVPGNGLHAILAPQLVLKGRFQPGDAQHIVHVVAFFPQRVGDLPVLVGDLPFFGSDLAHPSQHRRDDVALLITAGAGLYDLHARQRKAVFLDGRHGGVADLLRHDKVVHIRERLPVHFVVDACQHPLPGQGKSLQLVLFHQHLHDVVGGSVLLQTKVFLHICQLLLVSGAGGIVRKGIVACRIRLTDEQGVIPALAVFPEQLHQPLEHGIQILAAHQQLVEHHIVGGGAGGDPLTIAVHDVSPCRRYGKTVVGGIGGFGAELVAVDQLQKDQPQGIEKDHQCRRPDQQRHAADHDFAFVLIHPLFLRRSDHAVVDFKCSVDPPHYAKFQQRRQHRQQHRGQHKKQIPLRRPAVAGHVIKEQPVAGQQQPCRHAADDHKVARGALQIQLHQHAYGKAEDHDFQSQHTHSAPGGVVPHEPAHHAKKCPAKLSFKDRHRKAERQDQQGLCLSQLEKPRGCLQRCADQKPQHIAAPFIDLAAAALVA